MPYEDQRSAQSAEPKQSAEEAERERERKFLATALERFQLCQEAESDHRRESMDDWEFRKGNQWPTEALARKQLKGQPAMTMNRMPAFIKQVTNEQRQQRPSIVVNPVGDGADTDTAEIFQGGIRHIEVISDSEVAVDHAFDCMVTGGKGYWRFVTDYVDDDSFQQEIFWRQIKNPFSVYCDPAATEADESDARFKFIIDDIPRSEFKQDYPEAIAASTEDFSSLGNNAAAWASKDAVRVAEYFYVEYEQKNRARLSDGTVKDEDQLTEEEKGQVQETRPKRTKVVKWAKITAADILEERKWAGQWIPIVPVIGDDIAVNGKRRVTGMIRDMKDAQRNYDYAVSKVVEAVGLAPTAPWVAAEGTIEGFEKFYERANVDNIAVLPYKPKSVDGQLVPPPSRLTVEPPIQATLMVLKQADNDMKAISGVYDASLGQRGPDESGKAILARQKQTDVTNLNYSDNLSRAMRHSGRILVDLIPRIWDTAKIQRIIRPDGTVSHVGIYNSKAPNFEPPPIQPPAQPRQIPQAGPQLVSPQVVPHGTPQLPASVPEAILNQLNEDQNAQKLKLSIKKIYDIGVGRYDVTVSVGPSYQSKRAEAVASMMALLQAYPNVFPIIGDLMVRNMDWPLAKEISERLKKTLPPQLQDNADDDPQAQLGQLTQQHAQLVQELQMLTQQLTQAQNIIQTKKIESDAKFALAQMELRMEQVTKFGLAMIQRGTTLGAAEITTKAQDAQARAEANLELFQSMQQNAHEAGMQAQDQAHERNMAAQQMPPPQSAQPVNGQ